MLQLSASYIGGKMAWIVYDLQCKIWMNLLLYQPCIHLNLATNERQPNFQQMVIRLAVICGSVVYTEQNQHENTFWGWLAN
jgi:hypothetical protein